MLKGNNGILEVLHPCNLSFKSIDEIHFYRTNTAFYHSLMLMYNKDRMYLGKKENKSDCRSEMQRVVNYWIVKPVGIFN